MIRSLLTSKKFCKIFSKKKINGNSQKFYVKAHRIIQDICMLLDHHYLYRPRMGRFKQLDIRY